MSSKSSQINKSNKSETIDVIEVRKVPDVQDSKSSSRSRKKKQVVPDIDSDDIDVSQMELIANKKKLIKKPSDADFDISIQKEESSSKSEKKKSKKSSESSSSSSSSSRTKYESDETKRKRIQKENSNEYIRKEKSEYLYKFNKIHMREKWTSLKLDMNCSLEEIKNEFDRVTNAIKVDRSVRFMKKMLLLGVQGVEMLNNKFDPVGVDLEGWSEAMSYNMDNQDYDEVMAELYAKYKSVGNMSPEMKLVFMIISSAAFFTISKKITKMDSQNGIMSFLGNFMPQAPSQAAASTTPAPMPQFTKPQSPQIVNYQTETTEDHTPSKLNNPQKIQDTIAINNILDTMNKRQQEKDKQLPKEKHIESVMDDLSDEILKSIPSISSKKRGRGTGRKKVVPPV